VGSVVVVFEAPVFDEELGFWEGAEGFPSRGVLAAGGRLGFGVGILGRSSGLDVGGGVVEATPVVEGLGDEFGAVVAADEAGAWPRRDATCSSARTVSVCSQPAGGWGGERFPRVLVGDDQDLHRPAVMRLVLEI
jgi:hypothetical protein